jgi:hypothetical protein
MKSSAVALMRNYFLMVLIEICHSRTMRKQPHGGSHFDPGVHFARFQVRTIPASIAAP